MSSWFRRSRPWFRPGRGRGWRCGKCGVCGVGLRRVEFYGWVGLAAVAGFFLTGGPVAGVGDRVVGQGGGDFATHRVVSEGGDVGHDRLWRQSARWRRSLW